MFNGFVLIRIAKLELGSYIFPCDSLQITLDIDVQICRDLKTLVVEVAKNFEAHHVVLDRCVVDFPHFTTYIRRWLEVCRNPVVL